MSRPVAKGCGTTRTVKEIKARHPKALSCCPERKMVRPKRRLGRGDQAAILRWMMQ